MKLYHYRVGSRRVRATPRLGTKKRSVKRLKRHWAPYKYREPILYLIGLALMLICIIPIPLNYWYHAQAEHRFAIEAAQGKPVLAQVENVEDHGRAVLMPNSAYEYGDPFPTSGPHDRDWIDAGFYDSPRAPTFLVSALEREAVIIYYDKPQPSALETLRDWAGLFNGDRDGIVVVLHPGLDDEIVLTASDKRLRLPQFDPGAVAAFIDAFRGHGAERTG
jgi:hypothetical protein